MSNSDRPQEKPPLKGLTLQELERMREKMRASIGSTRAELERLEEAILAQRIKERGGSPRRK